MWLKDPKTKKASVTVTILVATYVVALMKLILSGSTVGSFSMEQFSGADFATIVGAVGALYAARKYTDKEQK